MWLALRQFEGRRFRRQAPIGDYVVDFVCHSSRLIIEVDGGVHEMGAVALRDAERDAWLVERGYRVLRVMNREVLGNIDAVVRRIVVEAGAGTPTPDPSPQGGGEV